MKTIFDLDYQELMEIEKYLDFLYHNMGVGFDLDNSEFNNQDINMGIIKSVHKLLLKSNIVERIYRAEIPIYMLSIKGINIMQKFGCLSLYIDEKRALDLNLEIAKKALKHSKYALYFSGGSLFAFLVFRIIDYFIKLC